MSIPMAWPYDWHYTIPHKSDFIDNQKENLQCEIKQSVKQEGSGDTLALDLNSEEKKNQNREEIPFSS